MTNFHLEVFKDGLVIQAYKELRQKQPAKADILHSVEIDLTRRTLVQLDKLGRVLKRYEIKENGKLVGKYTRLKPEARQLS